MQAPRPFKLALRRDAKGLAELFQLTLMRCKAKGRGCGTFKQVWSEQIQRVGVEHGRLAPLEDLPEDLLVIDGVAVRIPDGVGRLWQLGSVADAYRDLRDELAPLAAALSRGEALAPLDAMAARVLVNHSWRRIVLRDPGLPEALLPAHWPGEEARQTVRTVYAALAGPSEDWLDRAGMPGQVKPALFAGRFGGLGPDAAG